MFLRYLAANYEAAESADADEPWSEAPQTGATIAGIHIVNPLR